MRKPVKKHHLEPPCLKPDESAAEVTGQLALPESDADDEEPHPVLDAITRKDALEGTISAVRAAATRSVERRTRSAPRVAFSDNKMDAPEDAHLIESAALQMRLLDSLATASDDFMAVEVDRLEWAVRPRDMKDRAGRYLNAALALVHSVAPQTELEAALASQMAATHALSMEVLGKARHADDRGALESYVGMATKLQRTFAAQGEALAKLRGGGKQAIEVVHVHKHVYVAAGGQAIVGDVHGGGGVGPALAHQPQTPMEILAVASGEEVPRADPARDPVPRPSGVGEEALPDARRRG